MFLKTSIVLKTDDYNVDRGAILSDELTIVDAINRAFAVCNCFQSTKNHYQQGPVAGILYTNRE